MGGLKAQLSLLIYVLFMDKVIKVISYVAKNLTFFMWQGKIVEYAKI